MSFENLKIIFGIRIPTFGGQNGTKSMERLEHEQLFSIIVLYCIVMSGIIHCCNVL